MNLWSRHSNHGLRLRRHWIKVCRHIVYGLRRLLWRVQTRGEVLRLHHLKRMRMTTEFRAGVRHSSVRCSLWCRFASTTRCDVLCRKWHLLSTQHTTTPCGRKEDSNKGAHKGNAPGYFQTSTGSPGACACSGGPLARTGSRTVVAAASSRPSVVRREGAREAHMRTHARKATQTAIRRKHRRRARRAT
jgi:hypothetical protein